MLQNVLLEEPITGFGAPGIIPDDFRLTRKTELPRLRYHGIFTFFPMEESRGHRLYGYRFVDKIKQNGELRSRFCVQAFNDPSHGLLKFAVTIQRQSRRLLLEI